MFRGPDTIQKLKSYSLAELEELATEIRQQILTTCLKNGGHLGASLGTVELSIALHRSFNSPEDSLVWDVGHSAYAHKLLTGRGDRFQTLRQWNGISGFLSREESEHDVFGAGHSSTSLSAALGMAWAKQNAGRADSWSIAVIGDGGLTAGLAFEALNNFRLHPLAPLLVVLNDNQMSISENVGSIAFLLETGQSRTFFECFGLDYVGPVDGHDFQQLLGVFEGVRRSYHGKPVVVHVKTQKGKGYTPAEENPSTYHGVGPLSKSSKQKTFSDAFGESMIELAESDNRLVALTAAMPEGTGLTEFANRFPDRFFDVGIAEQHAVTFAAGLATQGLRPVVTIYSTFLQRAFDQVIHDVCVQKLPVIFALDRAGLVGQDGPTHHGLYDLAYLGAAPGMTIKTPATLDDLKEALMESLNHLEGPIAIRYPRGQGVFKLALDNPPLDINAVELCVVAVGTTFVKALRAKEKSKLGSRVHVISVTQVKPWPESLLLEIEKIGGLSQKKAMITIEDGSIRGGAGESLVLELEKRKILRQFSSTEVLGVPDLLIYQGTVGDQESSIGLSADDLAERMRSLCKSP